MSLLDTLPHKCRIQKRVRTRDEIGGVKDLRSIEQTDVACWDQPLSADDIEQYQKRGIEVTHKVYFNAVPNVTEGHEIVITERNGSAVAADNQRPLDVKAVTDPDVSAGLGVLYRILVYENKGASQ